MKTFEEILHDNKVHFSYGVCEITNVSTLLDIMEDVKNQTRDKTVDLCIENAEIHATSVFPALDLEDSKEHFDSSNSHIYTISEKSLLKVKELL